MQKVSSFTDRGLYYYMTDLCLSLTTPWPMLGVNSAARVHKAQGCY